MNENQHKPMPSMNPSHSDPRSGCPGRRAFLKLSGASLAATALTGCGADSEKPASAPTGEMSYRTSQKTGDRCSLLGYGCMRWPQKDGKIDQEKVNELVDYAIAHGVNYFDTAPFYIGGASEEATGIALSRHPRNSYYLATKLSTQNSVDIRSFEKSKEMLETSMKRLQVDYIDYYLIHCIGLEKEGIAGVDQRLLDNGMLDYLKQLRREGKVRNIGFSYHGDIKLFDHALAYDMDWDFVQIQLNYVDWKNASGANFDAEYLYNELVKRDIPAVVMEPLLGGRLAKVPTDFVEPLQALAPDQSIASWAFRYAGSFPNVLTVLSGMTYMDHLVDNLKTYSPLDPLDAQERQLLELIGAVIANAPLSDEQKVMMERLGADVSKFRTIPCTTCQYCMPCPYGVDIPSTFLHYNLCVADGIVDKTARSESYNEARQAFLVGYDRKVESLRQAQHCIGCNECVSHCPQLIKIPQEMQRIAQFREQLLKGETPSSF